jgi:hypothetical protein
LQKKKKKKKKKKPTTLKNQMPASATKRDAGAVDPDAGESLFETEVTRGSDSDSLAGEVTVVRAHDQRRVASASFRVDLDAQLRDVFFFLFFFFFFFLTLKFITLRRTLV